MAVTSLWADGRCYWPLHLVPYTPASRLPRGKTDPGFRTKPQLAAELVAAAQRAKVPFRAVVADCLDGDNTGFVEALGRAGVAFVLALKPRKGAWAPAEAAPTPVEAARELDWGGPGRPGPWRRVIRRFRDGHTETWWAADARLGGWGPQGPHRLVVATTDPARLPKLTTWYLLCNLPRPAARRAQQAQLSAIVATYGLRNWVEQGYKQVKDELGWADFQVRSDRAIRRHWTLVCCAFSFCWHAAKAQAALAGVPAPPEATSVPAAAQAVTRGPGNVAIPTLGTAPVGVVVSWPQALRRVRAWLAPWVWLQRCWRGWSTSPPPRPLQQALEWVRAGQPLYIYLPP